MSKRLRNVVSVFALSLLIWAGIIYSVISVLIFHSLDQDTRAYAQLSPIGFGRRVGEQGAPQ